MLVVDLEEYYLVQGNGREDERDTDCTNLWCCCFGNDCEIFEHFPRIMHGEQFQAGVDFFLCVCRHSRLFTTW